MCPCISSNLQKGAAKALSRNPPHTHNYPPVPHQHVQATGQKSEPAPPGCGRCNSGLPDIHWNL